MGITTSPTSRFALLRAILASALLALLLAACGGGGGSDGDNGDNGDDSGDNGDNGDNGNPPPGPPPPFQRIGETAGAAGIERFDMVFDATGNGLAAWLVQPGSDGQRLVVAAYSSATGTWGPEQVALESRRRDIEFALASGPAGFAGLATQDERIVYALTFANGQLGTPQVLYDTGDPDLYVEQVRLAASDTGFAALWLAAVTRDPLTFDDTTRLRASVFAANAWSAAADVSAVGDPRDATLASDGSGYFAAWRDGDELLGNRYAAGAWLATPLLIDEGFGGGGLIRAFGHAFEEDAAAEVASGGNGYQIVWAKGARAASVYTRTHDGADGLGDIVALEASDESTETPRIVANGSGFCVAWLQDPDRGLRASIGSGSTWSEPVRVDDPALTSVSQNFQLASNGGGCALAWNQLALDRERRLWASVYAGAWGAPTIVDTGTQRITGSPHLVSNGSGYAASWETFDTAAQATRHWASSFAGAWATPNDFGTAGSQFSGGGLFRQGDGYVFAWPGPRQLDGVALNVSRHAAGTWATAVDIARTHRPGAVQSPFLVHADNGLTLAAWRQKFGDSFGSYVSLRASDGSWGEPLLLSPDHPIEPEHVAASATGFAVLYTAPDEATGRRAVRARIHDGTAWGEAIALGDPAPQQATAYVIHSDGRGYAAVWRERAGFGDEASLLVSLFEAGAWSDGLRLNEDNGQAPSLASNGAGYAVTWEDGANIVPVRIYADGAWSERVDLAEARNNPRPRIAALGQGYVLAWGGALPGENERSLHASFSADGTPAGFATPVRLSDGNGASLAALTAHGARAAVAWRFSENRGEDDETSSVYASVLENGSWSSGTPLSTVAGFIGAARLTSGPRGHALAWTEHTRSSAGSLHASVYENETWSLPNVIVTGTDLEGEGGVGLAGGATGFGLLWTQVPGASSDGLSHVFLSTYGDTGWRAPRQLEDQAAAAIDASLSARGDRYSAAWAQPDPAGDPLAQQPWAYIDIE